MGAAPRREDQARGRAGLRSAPATDARRFDIISHATCLGGADLSATIRACFSINKTTGKKSDSNFTNFGNAEFNKILDQFSMELDQQKKTQLGRQLNQILNNEMPNTGVTYGGRAYGWYN